MPKQAKVTNNAPSPMSVRTVSGVVQISAGATRLLELTDQKLEQIKSRGYLSVEEIPDAIDRDSLKAKADGLGIEYPRNIKTDKLNDLIDAKVDKPAIDPSQTAA